MSELANKSQKSLKRLQNSITQLKQVSATWPRDIEQQMPPARRWLNTRMEQGKEVSASLTGELGELSDNQVYKHLTLYRVAFFRVIGYRFMTRILALRVLAIRIWRVKWIILGTTVALIIIVILIRELPNIVRFFQNLFPPESPTP